jgi:general secretion pathway protein A
MYTAYYELRQEPFHVTPDPEFLFPSPAHKEALAAIIYGIEQRKGFVAITGEVGVGKTTILRSYLDFADRQSLKLIYVYNSNLTFDELVTTILQELGIPDRPPSAFQAVTRLHEALIEVYRKNQTVVLIIDEAQNMPVETLESLRMLSNLETVTEKLIQIMLIGQPEFDELLQQHRLRQLRQRIAIHARIDPLNIEDSIAYLEHRLAKVSLGTKPVFTKNALRLVAESSQGIPRNLNILSDNALITGFGSQVRPVNTRIVKEVLNDRGVAPLSNFQQWRSAWMIGGAAAAAAVLVTVALLALQPGTRNTDTPQQAALQPAPPPAPAERSTSGGASPQSGSTNEANAVPRMLPDQHAAPAQAAPSPSAPAVVPPPTQTNPPRPPEIARAEPQPAPRPAPPRTAEAQRPAEPPPVAQRAPAPAAPPAASTPPSPPPAVATPAPPPRAPETTRTEPPQQTLARPAPAAEPPPAPTTRNEAAETGPGASTPPTRRSPPISLQPPPVRAPAAPATTTRPPAPSIAAAPPPQQGASAPPAAAVAVPSIMMPSASGSGLVAAAPPGSEALPPRAPASTSARAEQSVRTVRAGDSLWTLAEEVYGFVNPNVLRRVQDANPQLRNINILSPGQEIVFPRVAEPSFERNTTQLEGVAPPRN